MIEKFRAILKKEGRSFRWFHFTYLGKVASYNYFIVQINDSEKMQDSVKNIIQKYIDGV